MTARGSVALYARVSSESQARDNTIASQVAALRECIAADGFQLEPDHNYVDKATVVQSCFARRWSGYEMQLLAAKSSAFMSMPRIGSPAVTPIKCS